MKKVIIICIIILLGGLGYYIYSVKQQAAQTGEAVTLRSFLPFGTSSTGSNNTGIDGEADSTASNTEEGATDENAPLPKEILTQVTALSIAGGTTYTTMRPKSSGGTEEVVSLRYVEKTNGHIHEQFLDGNTSTQISNSTIQGVHEALFSSDGNSIIYRYLDSTTKQIQSFLGTLGASTGSYLPEGIEQIVFSPTDKSYFYLTTDSETSTVSGIKGGVTTNKETTLFTSAFTEWLVQWPNKNTIFLTTKPSWNTNGSVYQLNTDTKAFRKVFGNIRGLTTLANNQASVILYSGTTTTGYKIGLYDTATKDFTNIPLSSIAADKCVWVNDGSAAYCSAPNTISGLQYPDNWYQGTVSFDDSVYRIDGVTGSITQIVDTSTVGGIDGTHLFLNPSEDVLFLINKKDSSLWKIILK